MVVPKSLLITLLVSIIRTPKHLLVLEDIDDHVTPPDNETSTPAPAIPQIIEINEEVLWDMMRSREDEEEESGRSVLRGW